MTLGVVWNAASGLSPYGEALEYSTPYSSPLSVAKKFHFITLHIVVKYVEQLLHVKRCSICPKCLPNKPRYQGYVVQ